MKLAARPCRADAEAELDNFRSSVGLELVSLKTSGGDIGERVRALGNHHEVTAMAHRQVACTGRARLKDGPQVA